MEETLIELGELDFETDAILSEVVLITSLMLRSPDLFVFALDSGSAEYKSAKRVERNVWLAPLIPNLLRGRRTMFNTLLSWNGSPALLPDVCMSCLVSFPLTVGGRLRPKCPLCGVDHANGGGEDTREYIALMLELAVFFIPHLLFESLVAQLLYKYYSPTGDKTWQMILPTLTTY